MKVLANIIYILMLLIYNVIFIAFMEYSSIKEIFYNFPYALLVGGNLMSLHLLVRRQDLIILTAQFMIFGGLFSFVFWVLSNRT